MNELVGPMLFLSMIILYYRSRRLGGIARNSSCKYRREPNLSHTVIMNISTFKIHLMINDSSLDSFGGKAY